MNTKAALLMIGTLGALTVAACGSASNDTDGSTTGDGGYSMSGVDTTNLTGTLATGEIIRCCRWVPRLHSI